MLFFFFLFFLFTRLFISLVFTCLFLFYSVNLFSSLLLYKVQVSLVLLTFLWLDILQRPRPLVTTFDACNSLQDDWSNWMNQLPSDESFFRSLSTLLNNKEGCCTSNLFSFFLKHKWFASWRICFSCTFMQLQYAIYSCLPHASSVTFFLAHKWSEWLFLCMSISLHPMASFDWMICKSFSFVTWSPVSVIVFECSSEHLMQLYHFFRSSLRVVSSISLSRTYLSFFRRGKHLLYTRLVLLPVGMKIQIDLCLLLFLRRISSSFSHHSIFLLHWILSLVLHSHSSLGSRKNVENACPTILEKISQLSRLLLLFRSFLFFPLFFFFHSPISFEWHFLSFFLLVRISFLRFLSFLSRVARLRLCESKFTGQFPVLNDCSCNWFVRRNLTDSFFNFSTPNFMCARQVSSTDVQVSLMSRPSQWSVWFLLLSHTKTRWRLFFSLATWEADKLACGVFCWPWFNLKEKSKQQSPDKADRDGKSSPIALFILIDFFFIRLYSCSFSPVTFLSFSLHLAPASIDDEIFPLPSRSLTTP